MQGMKPYSKDQDVSYAIGFFAVLQLLETHPERVEKIYVGEESLESEAFRKIVKYVPERDIVVSGKAIERIARKENGHAMAAFRKWNDTLDGKEDHLVMVNPMDQGNLGNAMRSLLAFGFHDLAVVKPCADLFDPKTVRSSMGALFHIRVETFDSFESYIRKYPRPYYPFVLERSTPLSEASFSAPASLVFGNEATGLPKELYNENNVRIEQSDEVDSLNLTTAIAVALYELRMRKGK